RARFCATAERAESGRTHRGRRNRRESTGSARANDVAVPRIAGGASRHGTVCGTGRRLCRPARVAGRGVPGGGAGTRGGAGTGARPAELVRRAGIGRRGARRGRLASALVPVLVEHPLTETKRAPAEGAPCHASMVTATRSRRRALEPRPGGNTARPAHAAHRARKRS